MLWNVSEEEARRISRNFVDRSLAQSDSATESIRLHDLQLDYVRARESDKEALDLIHDAMRLSSHVIARDPGQFASQIVGRLLFYQDVPAAEEFTKRIVKGTHALKVWDLGSGRELRTLTGHTDSVNAVGVTPDEQRAVSASSDQTLKVWELETGRVVATFTCDGAALCCAVSVAPELIIAGDAVGHVRFLRLEQPNLD
jgi:hypothetical protein